MSFHQWSEIPEEKLTEMISRKIISREKVMATQVFLKKGSVVIAHKHESEQLTYILEGALEFTLPIDKFTVGKAQVLLIPGNMEHRRWPSKTRWTSTSSTPSGRTC